MQLAVTPHALLIDGLPLDAGDLAVVECAELLHDRDILQLTVASAADRSDRSIAADGAVARSRDAPLARRTGRRSGVPKSRRRSCSSRSTTRRSSSAKSTRGRRGATASGSRSCARSSWGARRSPSTSRSACWKSPSTSAPSASCARTSRSRTCTPDGSPMVTTQAATVLAVYRHIAKTVAALEPERVQEVIDSLALAAGNLEPGTALELLLQEEQQGDGIPIADALRQVVRRSTGRAAAGARAVVAGPDHQPPGARARHAGAG